MESYKYIKFVQLCYLTRFMLYAKELSLIWFRGGTGCLFGEQTLTSCQLMADWFSTGLGCQHVQYFGFKLFYIKHRLSVCMVQESDCQFP